MSVPKLIGLAALSAVLMTSAAFAITPLTDPQQKVKDAIAQQLGENRSFALVIGISEFKDPAWKDLTGIADEVVNVSTAFEKQGFQVTSKSGAVTLQDLTDTIAAFFRANGGRAENRLVVYIATHGYADKNASNPEGFLIPSDGAAPADGRVAGGYSVGLLQAALADPAVNAQHVFLFFNSCFSAAMLPPPTRAAEEGDRVAARATEVMSEETAKWTLELLSHNARFGLAAGNASQEVLDGKSPFETAVIDGLMGQGDLDGDGLILGTELAHYIRGRVVQATYGTRLPNDPVFAMIPKTNPPQVRSPDRAVVADEDYQLQGDFVFLNLNGPRQVADGKTEIQLMLEHEQAALPPDQSTSCVDCPTMVSIDVPEDTDGPDDVFDPLVDVGPRFAMSATEVTYAQWDACFRDNVCRRYIPDEGQGRGDRPVGGVTWLDALQYTSWLSSKDGGPKDPCVEYQLPTPAQWKHAALYSSFGNVSWEQAAADSFPVCWGCGPGQDGNAAIRTASSPANPAGLYDMLGNVWEWVQAPGKCDALDADNGICAPGTVMGGSYATRAYALASVAEGTVTVPRTGNFNGWSSPTIGFRVACKVAAKS